MQKQRLQQDQKIIAEVKALDAKPSSSERRRIRFSLNVSSPVARALPPPWAFRQRQLSGYGTDDGTDDGREETKDVEVTVPVPTCQVTQRAEGGMSPKMWDREMMQMCSQNGRAELKGRSCDLVEPYVPLVKPKRSDKEMELYHHQLPSPCMDRGSGFHHAESHPVVRYNLQLDGRRPFLPSAKGKMFREPRFLPRGEDLVTWDQELVMAPDRAYRASERGSSQFYDARRVQLPAWKPAGFKALRVQKNDLSRVGARILKGPR